MCSEELQTAETTDDESGVVDYINIAGIDLHVDVYDRLKCAIETEIRAERRAERAVDHLIDTRIGTLANTLYTLRSVIEPTDPTVNHPLEDIEIRAVRAAILAGAISMKKLLSKASHFRKEKP